jgi:hypothetical protein
MSGPGLIQPLDLYRASLRRVCGHSPAPPAQGLTHMFLLYHRIMSGEWIRSSTSAGVAYSSATRGTTWGHATHTPKRFRGTAGGRPDSDTCHGDVPYPLPPSKRRESTRHIPPPFFSKRRNTLPPPATDLEGHALIGVVRGDEDKWLLQHA